eukprot:TRINITY_DN4863_c0_g1_i2.p1 TRINITY_DN4863_c0_g1~~TRINITY_DN4863_c0_g1_i2.p1  ORF type:complete len:493 (+),score=84.21 TRINITY_DN4863_c0_g1_i2:171-1481(+)
MMGREFAQHVNEFLQSRGIPTHTIGVIQMNPEQSKHLETATVRIHNTMVDFVNLRSETYAEHSRIPSMSMGTPLQDAERRDLTINALFYNINTGSVEDWTGKGLADLEAGRVRTPLAPKETFLDDPLRVLRTIRFAGRFNFEVDPEILAAAHTQAVRSALATKVSRERVGVEIWKMLEPRVAGPSLRLLRLFGLDPIVFGVPPELESTVMDAHYQTALNLASLTASVLDCGSSGSAVEPSQLSMLVLSAYVHPFATFSYPDKKGRPTRLTTYFLREMLKYSTKVAEDVVQVTENVGRLAACIERSSRLDTGLALRSLQGLGDLAIELAAVLAVQTAHPALSSDQLVAKAALLSQNFRARVRDEGLSDVWRLRPIFNGAELQAMGAVPGPGLSAIIEELIAWQIQFPQGAPEAARVHALTLISKQPAPPAAPIKKKK